MKFKVGDRVRITSNATYGVTGPGSWGTVFSVGRTYTHVKFKHVFGNATYLPDLNYPYEILPKYLELYDLKDFSVRKAKNEPEDTKV